MTRSAKFDQMRSPITLFFLPVSFTLVIWGGCSYENPDNAAAVQHDTVFIREEVPYYITPAWAFTGNFDRRMGGFRFEVNALSEAGIDDSVHFRISRGSLVVVDSVKAFCEIEEVQVRDLDEDDFPELYIIGRSPGSGGFLCLEMIEANGHPVQEGDLQLLYSTHRLTFTAEQVIHEQWLETVDGCQDCTGIEFTYFKLLNNRFKLVMKNEWRYGDGEAVNETGF
jgi:hypothetical protein